MSNTNNNSISSIKGVKYCKTTNKNKNNNNLVKNLKQNSINEKLHLFNKNKESNRLNKFPLDLFLKTNAKIINNKNNNNLLLNNSKKPNNKSKNNKKKNSNKLKKSIIINKIQNSNNSNINNISKKFTKTQKIKNFANSRTALTPPFPINNSTFCSKKNKLKKNSNLIHTNNYIVNTLNVSEKNYLKNAITSTKQQKSSKKIYKNLETEISKIKNENIECQKKIKNQGKLIEKIKEDNDKLKEKIELIKDENNKIKQKIEEQEENQEQLIILIKLVQKTGIDVEKIIDDWNNEVELENELNDDDDLQGYEIYDKRNVYKNNKTDNNNYSFKYSKEDLNGKIDPSSFIPINIEEPDNNKNKKIIKGIPILNFDNINNENEGNYINKRIYRNHSK